jgi:hypothetical protein
MSAIFCIGFDVLVDKICSVHSNVHPQHASSGATVLAVGQKVKSSFTEGTGKRKADRSTTPSITPVRRDATGGGNTVVPGCRVIPCYSYDDMVPSRSPDDVINPFLISEAMPINQGIVPYHRSHHTSVLQSIYKHLSPKDIVRLLPGEELIVMILSIGPKTLPDVSNILIQCRNKFKRVLDKSLHQLYPGNCESIVADAVRARNTLV